MIPGRNMTRKQQLALAVVNAGETASTGQNETQGSKDCALRSTDVVNYSGRRSLMRARTFRHALASTLVAGLALTAAGCGLSGTEESDLPETSPSARASATPSASPAADAWRAKFSGRELKAYDQALQRWEEYESRSEPVWARGKVTPAAEALFKEYWMTYGTQLSRLETYELMEIAVSGTPEVLWSKAARFEHDARRVVIKQCIDPAPITVYDDGEADPPIELKPYVRTITLDRVATTNQFMVLSVQDDLTMKKVKPCD